MSECEYCDNLLGYGLLEAVEMDIFVYHMANDRWRTQPTATKRLVHPEMVPVSYYRGIRCRKDKIQKP